MPKSIGIGDMTASLDTKTGFIRVTSKESGSDLKKHGFVLNVTPGSKEYRLLMNAIIGNDEYDGEMERQAPKIIKLSDKYKSQDHYRIPLGLDADDYENVVTWNPQCEHDVLMGSPHLSLEGGSGSGKTTILTAIIEHLSRYPDNAHIYYHGTHQDSDDLIKNIPALRNIDFYESLENNPIRDCYDSLADNPIREAYSAMEERTLWAENKSKRKVQEAAKAEMKSIYVVIDKLESLITPVYDVEIFHTDENRRQLGHLLRYGKSVGIHLVLSCQRYLSDLLPYDDYADNVGMRVRPFSCKRNFRAAVSHYGKEYTIVPFHV